MPTAIPQYNSIQLATRHKNGHSSQGRCFSLASCGVWKLNRSDFQFHLAQWFRISARQSLQWAGHTMSKTNLLSS
ncbi:MAG TPA: hypothetical protein VFQ43_17425, partial [Nitrososphaera sp.]|nr:hypothetical protein [Nitrososphaera sp.]